MPNAHGTEAKKLILLMKAHKIQMHAAQWIPLPPTPSPSPSISPLNHFYSYRWKVIL